MKRKDAKIETRKKGSNSAHHKSISLESLESHFSRLSVDLNDVKLESIPDAKRCNNASTEKHKIVSAKKLRTKVLATKAKNEIDKGKGLKKLRKDVQSKESPEIKLKLQQSAKPKGTKLKAKNVEERNENAIEHVSNEKSLLRIIRVNDRKSSKQPKRISNMPIRQQKSTEIFKQISMLTAHNESTLSPSTPERISNKILRIDSDRSTTKQYVDNQRSVQSGLNLSKPKSLKMKSNFKIDSGSKGIEKKKMKKINCDFKKIMKKLKDPTFLNTKDVKNDTKTCRICFSTKSSKQTGDLITPCNCRGIFSTVHQKCIADWIVSMCSDTCDVCRFKFFIKAKQKGLFDFIIEEGQFGFIWRLLSIVLFSLYLVLVVSTFIRFVERFQLMNHEFIFLYKTSTSLIIFMMLTYVGYYFVGRYLNYRKWRKNKYHITVHANSNNKFNEIITPPFDPIRSSGLGESIRPFIRPVLSIE